MTKVKKLTIAKYLFILGIFLAVAGALIGITYIDLGAIKEQYIELGLVDYKGILLDFEGNLQGAFQFVEKMKIATPVLLPMIFIVLAFVMVVKDEIAKKIKLPKGVGIALLLLFVVHIVMFVGKYVLVAMYSYLFVTTIVALYFDPAIAKAEKEENNNG